MPVALRLDFDQFPVAIKRGFVSDKHRNRAVFMEGNAPIRRRVIGATDGKAAASVRGQ